MSNELDKSWITLRYPDPLFYAGVKSFLKFVDDNLRPKRNKIKCPCVKCGNKRISLTPAEVEYHLVKFGFTPTYTFWNFHGEGATFDRTERDIESEQPNNDAYTDNLEESFSNPIPEEVDGKLDGDGRYQTNEIDNLGETTSENPTNEFSMVEEFMKALYPGCDSFTVGSFVVKLFDLKVRNKWSDRSLVEILQLFKEVLPSKNKVPSNKYRAEKIMEKVSLDYQKIHACPNDCILYWGKYSSEQECPTCHASRYKVQKVSKFMRTRVPAKVLWYFPITKRLNRMYSVPWVAKEMTWHSTGRMPPGKMGHPVDSSVWKSLDNHYKDFGSDPRNVRLGLATDGFNPFGTCRSSYSSWPVMCVPYNLPPNLCMKPEFTMLALLIEGPKQPGNDIDVYLQPLVKELEDLWDKGATVFDAFSGTNFNMRAALLWTIHDFPAYGNISGCKTKGRFACPPCGPKVGSLRLRYGKKNVYANFRRWLPLTDDTSRKDTNSGTFNMKEEHRRQPLRLSATEVESITSKLKVQWGKSEKRKKIVIEEGEDEENYDPANCFSKRSILFNLKYWKNISVRHNLDVMHIEKNVCEIIIALMLNTKGKTKDDVNARRDLRRLKIKKRMWLKKENGKVIQPPCHFWLTKEEKKLFFQTLRDLRVPIGFSSNWKNLVTDDGLDLKGLKSHDYHILMQHLLPMLTQHAFKDRKEVRSIIRSFSTFFNALCSRVIDVDTISTLERGMARTLCELEKICPPSVFVVMMHLPIHLAYEARVCGPVYYRWMYPFERFMKTFKGYVGNKARPEGCIAARYIKEEAIVYCKSYRREGEAIFKHTIVNRTDRSRQLLHLLDDDEDENYDDNRLIGSGKKFVMSGNEYEQARRWVLRSHPNYDMWERKYDDFLQSHKRASGRRSGSYKVSSGEEFIPWLKKELETEDYLDKDFLDIVNGPKFFATRYKKCCMNGYLFVTKDREEDKRYQNSGVSTNSTTTFRSSAKDKAPIDEDAVYYGVLQDIIQLEYRGGYKPILFKCNWVKVTHHGIKWDEQSNLRLINLTNIIGSDQLGDEPFILAEHAKQVFYSADPKDPEWHVVLEVPPKVYVEDETSLLSNQPVITDEDVGPSNNGDIYDDELIFNDPEEIEVIIERPKKRKRIRKNY